MKITVLLADDHAVVRDGLRALLELQDDITVVGEASNGSDVVQQVGLLRPDIVVMDIAMPEMDGIEAARQVAEVCPSAKVIILSMHGSVEHVRTALEIGVRGYIVKESAGAEVVHAVRAVYAGGNYLSPKITDLVVDDYLRQCKAVKVADPLAILSLREREVLQLVVDGKSSAEIAGILCLSPKTVETYRSRLMQKLGVDGLTGLVKLAIQHGLT